MSCRIYRICLNSAVARTALKSRPVVADDLRAKRARRARTYTRLRCGHGQIQRANGRKVQ
jgi:hypothetical protein